MKTGQDLVGSPAVGEWLDRWLAGKRIRKSSISRYETDVRVHLKPHLGDRRLDRPRVSHLSEMFTDAHAGILEQNAHVVRQSRFAAHGTRLGIDIEAVERNPQQTGFVPQPKRWKVEQTYRILISHRRLVRDYDHQPASSASAPGGRCPTSWSAPHRREHSTSRDAQAVSVCRTPRLSGGEGPIAAGPRSPSAHTSHPTAPPCDAPCSRQQKTPVSDYLTWGSSEPPSRFEPETYALRGHD